MRIFLLLFRSGNFWRSVALWANYVRLSVCRDQGVKLQSCVSRGTCGLLKRVFTSTESDETCSEPNRTIILLLLFSPYDIIIHHWIRSRVVYMYIYIYIFNIVPRLDSVAACIDRTAASIEALSHLYGLMPLRCSCPWWFVRDYTECRYSWPTT